MACTSALRVCNNDNLLTSPDALLSSVGRVDRWQTWRMTTAGKASGATADNSLACVYDSPC
eukprot:6023779-Amphidinium_carterae.1